LTDKTRILTFANIVEKFAATILTPQKTILSIMFLFSRVGTSYFNYDQALRKVLLFYDFVNQKGLRTTDIGISCKIILQFVMV
jgi:hypothetical protein